MEKHPLRRRKAIFSKDIKNYKKPEFIQIKNLLAKRKLSDEKLAKYFLSMKNYIKTGISLLEASFLVSKENKDVFPYLQIFEHLKKGDSLSNALENTKFFDEISILLIKSGEEGGDLEGSFDILSKYYEDRAALKNDFLSAVFYPLILFISLLFLFFFINFYFIPRLLPFITSSDIKLSGISSFFIGISFYLNNYTLQIFILAISIFLALMIGIALFAGLDRVKIWTLKIPYIGKIIKYNIIINLSSSYIILLKSGRDIVSATEFIIRQKKDNFINGRLNILKGEIIAGESISKALESIKATDNTLIYYIKMGEKSGDIVSSLEKMRDVNRGKSEMMIKRLMKTVEPFMIVLIALILGVSMMAIIRPMLEITGSF